MDWEEEFSKAHPLNSRIKPADIFLHATSIERYSAIQSSGCLLRNAPKRNFDISQDGVCFEKYKSGRYCGVNAKAVVDGTLEDYCEQICKRDRVQKG